jgi:hypothetical protein
MFHTTDLVVHVNKRLPHMDGDGLDLLLSCREDATGIRYLTCIEHLHVQLHFKTWCSRPAESCKT